MDKVAHNLGKGTSNEDIINIEFGASFRSDKVKRAVPCQKALSADVNLLGTHDPGSDEEDCEGESETFESRPELSKAKQCNVNGCESCTHEESCFHGQDVLIAPNQYWGYMVLDEAPNSPSSTYSFEVWASCDFGSEAAWLVECGMPGVVNGDISIRYNGTLLDLAADGGKVMAYDDSRHQEFIANSFISIQFVPEVTDAGEDGGGGGGGGDGGDMGVGGGINFLLQQDAKAKTVATAAAGMPTSTAKATAATAATAAVPAAETVKLEVIFKIADPSQRAAVQMYVAAINVNKHVDGCMAKKDCLHVFGDPQYDKTTRFVFRNDNTKQASCVNEETEKLNPQEQQVCNAWSTCLKQTGNHDALMAFLGAKKGMSPSLGLEQRSISSTDSESQAGCVHPTIDDPESWDCNCGQVQIDACKEICKTEPDKCIGDFLFRCIRRAMCTTSKICDSWKTTERCGDALADPQLLQKQSADAASNLTKEEEKQALQPRATAGTKTGSLDETMDDKCK